MQGPFESPVLFEWKDTNRNVLQLQDLVIMKRIKFEYYYFNWGQKRAEKLEKHLVFYG